MKVIKSASLEAVDASQISLEASFNKGLPSFTIVGLISASIQESKDRVKSALLSNDFKFPPLKITINLAPSEIKKRGSHFDLAIALLVSLQDSKKVNFENFHVFGELGLDGKIKDTSSIFPIVLSLKKQGLIDKVLVCKETAKKISKIPDIKIYVVDN